MKINWRVRFRNPVFWAQLVASILTPIIGYAGLTFQDLSSWPALGRILIEAIANPYIVGLTLVSVWNCVNDPTTKGISDSERALSYDEPY